MDSTPTFAVVLPVYNLAGVVGTVLGGINDSTWQRIDHMIVLDNCSTDGTPEAVRRFVEDNPSIADRIDLVRNERNLGYGGSVTKGLRLAMETSTHVAIMHGDDQADWDVVLTDLYERFTAVPGCDIVLACRFSPGSDTSDYSLARRLGNHFFNHATTILTGVRMSDAGTAMILARTDLFRGLPLEHLDQGYMFHPYLNLLLFDGTGVTTAEVPLMWRDASVDNQFQLVRYGLGLLKVLSLYGFRRRVLRRSPARSLGITAWHAPNP